MKNIGAMSDVDLSALSALYDQASEALVPFFLDAATNDVASARETARDLLDCYKAVTPKELQLATQIVAFGWASLACLGASSAVQALSIDDMLDLQKSALTLNGWSVKSTNALEARRKERAKNPAGMTPENTRWDAAELQLALGRALGKLAEANARLAVYMAAMEPAAAKPAERKAVQRKAKLPILFAEPMTPSVLARRARH